MNEIPPGWTFPQLGELTESAVDGPFGSNLKTEHYVDGPGVRVIRLQNIGVGVFNDADRAFISQDRAADLYRHDVLPGDLLVASLGDETHPVARSALYPVDGGQAIVKADCFRFRLNTEKADPSFIRSVLNCPSTRTEISGLSQGVTRDRINLTSLKRLRIALPPVGEQRRIAQILDADDEAIRSTERLIAKLEQCKTGLVQDLLSRALAESGAVAPLGDVSNIAGGVTLGRSISGSETVELPYLRVANVQDGFIDTSEMKTVRILRAELERYRIRAGDVMMTEGGDFDKLRRGAVWDGSIDPCLHQNHIFRVRCTPSLLLPKFLALYSASPTGRRYFVLISKQTTNLASINMTQLKSFPTPIPPLMEQLRIVSTIDAQDEEILTEKMLLRKLLMVRLGLMDDLLTGRVRAGTIA
jgi:type I restriction enzyme, S subunit